MGISLYRDVEQQTMQNHNLRCIDGSLHSCSKCTGLCSYSGHPGFLTAKLEAQHDCLNKNCCHYTAKTKTSKPKKPKSDNARILSAAKGYVDALEGVAVVSAAKDGDGWRIHYVTISNGYDIASVARRMSDEMGCDISFIGLNYPFEVCAELVMKK